MDFYMDVPVLTDQQWFTNISFDEDTGYGRDLSRMIDNRDEWRESQGAYQPFVGNLMANQSF